jgi:hypothetical protein
MHGPAGYGAFFRTHQACTLNFPRTIHAELALPG